MGYKTKSMLKQLSGLSANYYLDKELNKFTNKISEKPKQGESIAKSSKKFTPFEILKSKGSAIKRDEKKQIRKAGREAARNTDVDFVKATPMGSDYFSLMAATAENLASRGAGKRKAKKEAKSLKREMLSEGRDVKPIEGKGVKKIQSASPIPPASKEEIKVPKKTDRFKTLPKTPDDPSLVPKIKQKVNKREPVKDYLTDYGPLAPPSSNQDLNKNFGRKIYDVTVQTVDDARDILTRKAGKEIEQKVRDMKAVGESRAKINRVAQKFTKDIAFAEKLIRTGTNTPSIPKANAADFDAKLQESKNKKKEEREAAKKRAIEEAQERLGGVQMLGDGFNKGMSRKNKYKK